MGADRPHDPAFPPLQRHVAGARPDFHADPAIDRLLRMVLTLTSELSVLAERLSTVEALAGIDTAAIEAYRPDPDALARREARREALLARLLSTLTDELDSLASGDDRDRYWAAIRRIEAGEM